MNGSKRRFGGWAIAAGLTALIVVAYLIRYVLLPFVIAGALTYVTAPVVRLLHGRLRFPRGLAVVLVFVVVTAILGGLAYWIGTAVVEQTIALANKAPEILERLLHQVLGADKIELLGRSVDARSLANEILGGLATRLTGPSDVARSIGASFALLMGGFLTLVLYFYFLLDGAKLGRAALWLVPPGGREEVRSLALRVDPLLRRYIIGLAVVVFYTSVISWLGIALLLHIPHAEMLAVATGILELVPVVGPIASAAIVGAAAIERGGVLMLVLFVAFYIALRLSIDQVVGPLVLGRAARLHPVVIIFAFLAGGVLFGPLGVLLAVPVAGVIKIILAAYYGEPEI